jgi:hypothetical protein
MMNDFEKKELNRCVECCEDMSGFTRDELDLCNKCFETLKVHLPIPPQCLMDISDAGNGLKALSWPRGGPNPLSELASDDHVQYIRKEEPRWLTQNL